MYKTNFDFIVEKAKTAFRPYRVAIAGADVENVLKGTFQAQEDGFVKPILLGNEEKIRATLKKIQMEDRDYELIPTAENENVVQEAIDMVKAGEADILMRGNTQTRTFLLPILDKKNKLIVDGRLLTHITMLDLPEYERLIAVSDVTVIVHPSQEQKKQVIRNLVSTLRMLGYDHPNIALLSLIEKPAFHMPGTIEADNIVRSHRERPIADCELVGPIAYDLIMSKEAARLKNYDCDLCGEFDGMVVPDLLSGNILVKALTMATHCRSCGVIAGATIPVAVTSRSDEPDQAYLSLAICAAIQPLIH